MKDRKPNEEYIKLVKETMPKSRHISTMVKAFLVGGAICVFGQGIFDIFKLIFPAVGEVQIKTVTTMTLVLIAGVLTGFGVYDKIGLFGGAGSLVPITGFANSVVSPSMEHKREGVILGLCSNMFKMAGPVIVMAIAVSLLAGISALIFPAFFKAGA
ncbi:MAG: SpoVA/SpoVAEb family sporulation membrane protein [Firmicutes bacterium]|nr:SpoVA/SpoVAEb family sporulation membrane protein [Bacillota bacterium]